MSDTTNARAAAREARANAALDRTWRDRATGEHYTFRQKLEAGAYAYRVKREYDTRATTYGLISHQDAADALASAPDGGRELYPGHGHPLQELTFAAFADCPKLVFDYVDNLPTVETHSARFNVAGVE